MMHAPQIHNARVIPFMTGYDYFNPFSPFIHFIHSLHLLTHTELAKNIFCASR